MLKPSQVTGSFRAESIPHHLSPRPKSTFCHAWPPRRCREDEKPKCLLRVSLHVFCAAFLATIPNPERQKPRGPPTSTPRRLTPGFLPLPASFTAASTVFQSTMRSPFFITSFHKHVTCSVVQRFEAAESCWTRTGGTNGWRWAWVAVA
jgi:hypothetical protein